jgi:hypothetical protein
MYRQDLLVKEAQVRNKILAVVVALAGFGAAAAIPMSAGAASTGTTPSKLCPAGVTNVAYCTNYCPAGTLVGAYCETVSTTTTGTVTTAGGGTVLPQGPPTVFSWIMWGSKNKIHRGPALKFHVKSGINGAPYLKMMVVHLPAGLTFTPKAIDDISVGGHALKTTKTSMTVDLRTALPSLYVYVKNHLMIESAKLRSELISGKIKTLIFHVTVTDAKGLATNLTFSVKPTV